jgi:ATP phosphoribosyltransferase regulatory subunit
MDVGHVAVFRSLVQAARSAMTGSRTVRSLQKKDARPEGLTKKTDAKTRAALLLLPELYGGKLFWLCGEEAAATSELQKALNTCRPRRGLPDPGELRPRRAARLSLPLGRGVRRLLRRRGGAVARGGRYDEVGKAFGRPRAATGFSIELRSLASAMKIKKKKK